MRKTIIVGICVFLFAAMLITPVSVPNDAGEQVVQYAQAGTEETCVTMTDIPPLPSDPGQKPAIGDPPAAFNWRNNNGDWTTPARDQGSCGSCWAFAAVSALESLINVREELPTLDPDLSEQYILSCLPSSGSCSGGSAYQAFQYIMDTGVNGNGYNGIIPEHCFPYQASDSIPCASKCSDWEQRLIPLADYGYWNSDGTPTDRERIKTQVIEEGPVVTYMEATDDFKDWGRSHHGNDDYYPYQSVSGHNHCVAIIGWKDDSSIERGGFWVCKNSWGTAWGHQGFFNIVYGSLNIDTIGICWVDYSPVSVDWPPVADAGGPYHATIGEPITFDGRQSQDAEGDIISYEWAFDDGSVMQGQSVSHAFETRGIHTVTLTVTDDNDNQGTATEAAYVEPWHTDESWTYDFNEIYVELENGVTGEVDASINGLSFSVENEDYTLTFRGKITGEYDIAEPLACTGQILWSSATGSVQVDKEFGFTAAEITIRVLATVRFPELLLPIPVPVTLKGVVSFTDPWRVLGFPLTDGKEWSTSLSSVSLQGSVSTLLGLISQPIFYSLELPALSATCQGLETVNVDAGTYEAYHVSYLDLIDIWYAPAIANIVKITASYGDSSLAGELTDTSRR